jgi:hypothetical protein
MMQKIKSMLGLAAGITFHLSGTLEVYAQDPQQSKSPGALCEHSKLNTQDADPLGAGALQLQFNFSYSEALRQFDSSWSKNSRGHVHEFSSEGVLTYGVTDDLDVGAGLSYSILSDKETDLEDGQGFSDLGIGAKWRFMEIKESGLAFAYLPALTIPTGKSETDEDLGTSQEFWSLDTRFAVVKDWRDDLSSNLDVGYEIPFGDKGNAQGCFSANGAIGYHLLPWLQPEVELNYSHDFNQNDPDSDLVAMTLGAALPLSDLICARAGYQRALAGRNTDDTGSFIISADINF